MSAEPKVNIERFLSDLGKATKRGVRKCPQCGTLNGTRGVSCKNGACNYVFKEVVVERRKFSNFDSCKLVTDDPAFDVFSVRIRERGGADDRAFVRVEPKDAVFEEVGPDSGHIARSSIRVTCFVDSCNKKSITIVVVPSASGWKHLPERDDTPCDHAISCLQAKKEAMPFPLKQSVLNSMPISSDWKQKIWLKARNDGPLVQRVSNTAMAVKCDLDLDQNPLGCLHTYFFSGSNSSSSKSSPEVARFVCSCQPRLDIDKSPSRKRILNCNSAIANSAVRCIHFCSCVAVFSGDQNLSKEFAKFLIDDKPILSKYQPEVMEIYGQDEEGRPIRVEVLDEALLSDNFQIEDNSSTSRTTLPTLPEDLEFQFEMEGADGTIQTISVDASEELIPLYDPDFERVTRRDDFASKESSPSTYLSSLQWVGSVAEHINLSMNYQFNGDPDPLVFVVPQCFFDVLRERLSFGKTKKRLPNSTISYQRTETSPIGTYTKYIWKLVNIFQVKNLFENPFVQLDVCRKFVLSKDHSFSYSPMDVSKPSSSPVYKTYLKVGQMTPDTSSVTPFIIEWTPDLLPKTKFGELRIIFKFGHMRDGQVDISRSSNKSGLF